MKQIIYLDDDPNDIEALSLVFSERDDYDLVCFGNVDPLFEHIRQNGEKVRLIILDQNMPEMSGIDVLKEIRGRFPALRIPAILFSTGLSPENADHASELEGVAIEKPATINDLRRTVVVMIRFCEDHTSD
ncbi:response regulator [Flaviaesturariibacter amylovorans]|uniref:Response regulatory domain-containing protein n=1 Tax=Flaviaesturariibacter amylovorans TaxID=1084520 RepID=A0ABP8H6I3_9BACT